MKTPAILLIFILLCLVAAGCTRAPAPADHTPSAVDGLSGVILSSEKPNATFTYGPGVVIVSFQVDSPEKMFFLFSNLSQGYGLAGTEFSTSGPFAGSVAFQAAMNDTYNLNITGTGRWTAAAAPLVTTNPLKAPVNLSGTGTMVTPVFYLEKGEYFFSRNETGLSSPLYQIQFGNGSPLMDANNTFVQPGFGALSPHPFTFITIPENGTYYLTTLSRNNPGNWSASIQVVPKLPAMGPGPEIYPLTK